MSGVRRKLAAWTLGPALALGSLAWSGCATRFVAQAAARFSPEVTYFFPTGERAVALTIDDGPDPVGTAAILDVLAEHDASATFFLIGSRVAGNEALLDRMQEDAHEIANHTYFERASVGVPPDELEAELEDTHSLLSEYGAVRWFRPGSGMFTRDMLGMASSHGYRTALGDVFPLDPLIPSSRFHSWFILRHVRPGSVIVLHDAHGRGVRTADTLATVIPALQERGYRIVTLSELEAMASDE